MRRSSKNVCILRHGYFPTDVRVYKEATTLSRAGYSVDVVCLRREGQKKKEVVDNVNVFRISHQHKRGSIFRYCLEYSMSLVKMAFVLTRLYFLRPYKCIQVNTLPDHLVFATIIPRIFGAKILLDMHEPTPELYITRKAGRKKCLSIHIIVFLEKVSIKYANMVITVNETIRTRFIERGANPNKIKVVRNVPRENFGSGTMEPFHNKGFTLITHGTILKHYGHEVIIRAIPLIRDQIEGLRVIILGKGEGEYFESLKTLCADTQCCDVVTFVGRVPFDNVKEYIVSSDIGIVPLLPSAFSDLCQPNKLFEYVALKRPVVCSRLEAIEESFDDSSMKYFEPGDYKDLACKILELYNDPVSRKHLAEKAYSVYEQLRWETAKEQYLDIVDQLSNSAFRH